MGGRHLDRCQLIIFMGECMSYCRSFLMIIFYSVSILVGGFGCSDSSKPMLLVANPNPQNLATGSLHLNLAGPGQSNSSHLSTIGSGTDMTIASYDIAGVGPGGASINMPGIHDTSVEIHDIAVGSWSLSVTGRNASGQNVGRGTVTALVQPGVSTAAQVTVRPLTGTGTLLISVSWPTGLVVNPSIVATLSPGTGEPINLAFILAGDTLSASYAGSDIATGYYTLNLKLKSGDLDVWGAIQAVRITADENTTASFPLTVDTINTGKIDINIIQEMDNPITVNLARNPMTVMAGSTMTVTATPSQTVDSFQWYLDCNPIPGQTAASITIGEGLTGMHRLDVVVKSGNVIGSNGFSFGIETEQTIRIVDYSVTDGSIFSSAKISRSGDGSCLYYMGFPYMGFENMYYSENSEYGKVIPSQGTPGQVHIGIDFEIDAYLMLPRVGTVLKELKGIDNTQLTSDDVPVSIIVLTERINGAFTESWGISYGFGTDGVPQTADDTVNFYFIRTYDGQGRCVSMKEMDPGPDLVWLTDDDAVYSMRTFEYDANGRIIKGTVIDPPTHYVQANTSSSGTFTPTEPTLSERTGNLQFVYSATGLLERIDRFDLNNNRTSYVMKSYDAKGRMIRSRKYNDRGLLQADREFQYY